MSYSIKQWARHGGGDYDWCADLVLAGLGLAIAGGIAARPAMQLAGAVGDAGATAISVVQQGNNNPVTAIANSGSEFDRVMRFISRVEGGWSNHPDDRGGATKYGIIASVARRHGYDVRSLTPEQAKQIYYKDYWIPSGASSVPWPLNLAIMNSYVNSGKKWQIIGSTPQEQATNYVNQQTAYYRQIIANNPSQQVFANGWFRRSRFMLDAINGGNLSW